MQSKESHDTDKIKKHGLDRLKDSADKKSVSSVQSNKSVLQTEEIRPGYKLTKVGWVPEDWKVTKLDSVVEFLDEQRKPIKESDRAKRKGKIPYYGASGIIDYIDDYIFDDELILLGEDGANVLTRSTPLAFKISGKAWVNNHAHVLKTKPGYHIGYYTEFLESLDYKKYNTSQSQPKLNKGTCKTIDVLEPPKQEQKAIAQVLSTWDKAIENLNQLITEKQQKKKALMQQLLTGKKRFPGFDGEWKEVKIGEYFTDRKESKREDLPLLSIGSSGVYPQTESNKKDTSNTDKAKYKRICPDDIGYNTMRMWQGRSALSSLEGIVSPAYTIVTPKENADVLFFSYLFKFPYVIHRFFRNSQGLVEDTLNCKFKDFAIVKVMVPPTKEEQTKIAQVLKNADAEIKVLEKNKEHLQDQKKGLM